MSKQKPFIAPSTKLPELTFKAIILGILLSIILSAANAYLGLTAGMTVSASIPAAVLSMSILRLFRNSNILENNIVQTSASAGEALAAGAIFTFPALIILGVWTDFSYFETTMITLIGGILGVMFSITLRTIFIINKPLKFPEGVATSEVLKAGNTKNNSIKYILHAALIGIIFKIFTSGLKLWPTNLLQKLSIAQSQFTFTLHLSPAMSAVGFILGLNVALVIFIGSALNWWLVIPLYPYFAADDLQSASTIWQQQTRFIGVGAMLIGGL